MNVLDILRAEGTVSIGQLVASGAPSFVQSAYNALNNGTSSLVILTADGASMADSLAEALGDAADVRVCNEPKRGGKGAKNVKDLVSTFERRNAANANALDNTYGRVNIPADGGIYNDSGDLVGFVVEGS